MKIIFFPSFQIETQRFLIGQNMRVYSKVTVENFDEIIDSFNEAILNETENETNPTSSLELSNTACDLDLDSVDFHLRWLKNQPFNQNSKGFRCEMYPKTYPNEAHLKTHMETHTEERPFMCDICLKLFLSEKELSSHFRKMHQEPKVFQCELCLNCFDQEDRLNAHLKNHSRALKVFKCEKCEHAFEAELTLRVHVRYYHSENV